MRTTITLMAAALIALGGGEAAVAVTPSATAAFTAGLKLEVKKQFKKQAPALVLRTLTCTAAKGALVYHCHAHFTDASAKAKIVYGITASLHGSSVTFSTSEPSCTAVSTGAPIRC
jgi:citrate lyase gamma subunit